MNRLSALTSVALFTAALTSPLSAATVVNEDWSGAPLGQSLSTLNYNGWVGQGSSNGSIVTDGVNKQVQLLSGAGVQRTLNLAGETYVDIQVTATDDAGSNYFGLFLNDPITGTSYRYQFNPGNPSIELIKTPSWNPYQSVGTAVSGTHLYEIKVQNTGTSNTVTGLVDGNVLLTMTDSTTPWSFGSGINFQLANFNWDGGTTNIGHVFVTTDIPEPASLALLGGVLILIRKQYV